MSLMHSFLTTDTIFILPENSFDRLGVGVVVVVVVALAPFNFSEVLKSNAKSN